MRDSLLHTWRSLKTALSHHATSHAPAPRPQGRRQFLPRHIPRRATAIAAMTALAAGGIAPAAFAAEDPALVSVDKHITAPLTGTVQAGSRVAYSVQVACTYSPAAGCADVVLDDVVPAPLVLDPDSVSVVGTEGGNFRVTTDDNTVRVQFVEKLDGGERGLSTGDPVTVQYQTVLPADTSADFDGATATNTATVTASNVKVSPITAQKSIALEVQATLQSSFTKSAEPDAMAAVPGALATFTLGAANTSNGSVDALSIQDPADAATQRPFAAARLTGIGAFTAPEGADRVRVDWLDAEGAWATGTPRAIPANPDDLLASLPAFAGKTLADIHGLRVTFSKAVGQLPASVNGAVVALEVALRDDAVAGTLADTAASWVTRDGVDSAPATGSDSVTLDEASLNPRATKIFDDDDLTSEDATTVVASAQNGDFPIDRMTLTEPAAGTPDLAAQGLRFGGFVEPAVEWPLGATKATVAYAYADGFAEAPRTTTERDTLPAADPDQAVVGFTVTFEGAMGRKQYASVPFRVAAEKVAGSADRTATNTLAVEVASGAQTADAAATDEVRLRPLRVAAQLGKNVTPDALYAIPGSTVRVDLPAVITPASATDGSTVGSSTFVVEDRDPQFWGRFNLTSISSTLVPGGSTMMPRYWNGSAWVDLLDEPVAGPQTWSWRATGSERESIAGIQFAFAADEGTLLPPGFQVTPHLQTQLRATVRGTSDPTVEDGTPTLAQVGNTATATSTNHRAEPATATATSTRALALREVPSNDDGDGESTVDLVDKHWIDPHDGQPRAGVDVVARTEAHRDARLTWDTDSLPMKRVTVSDPGATPGAVAGTVYEAFDLVRVKPITDAAMRFDAVDKLERWSVAQAGWVEVAGVCDDGACDGAFPGWTVPKALRDDTAGVRLTFVESPTRDERAGVDDPAVGSGVAMTPNRPIDLEFEIRDQRRSDTATAVLGEAHHARYNTGQDGVVRNTVTAVGTTLDDTVFTSSDGANILVYDTLTNVTASKAWDQDHLPRPSDATPADEYPMATATLRGVNTTAARINELTLADPNPGATSTPDDPIADAYDILNLAQIDAITAPAGATDTRVVLMRAGGGETTHSAAEAQALAEADLRDVVGVVIQHTGRVEQNASADAQLVFRLRTTHRGSGEPVAVNDHADNTFLVTGVDAGGAPQDVNSADARDSLTVVDATYTVETSKAIVGGVVAGAPSSDRYEDDPDQTVRVDLAARPSGTVRTTGVDLTDVSPTFWNAFDFTRVQPLDLPAPVERVRLSVLVGVTHELDAGGDVVVRCDGDADLADCWRTGEWAQAGPDGSARPALPVGVDADDVRGVRLSFERLDGGIWERPFNPEVTASIVAERRDTLRVGPDGGDDTPVPSTLPGMTRAPGEPAQGTTTNASAATAFGAWPVALDGGTTWRAGAEADATTTLVHRPNQIDVTLRPAGTVSPGQDIPYRVVATNTGDWTQRGLTLVMAIPLVDDSSAPMLVEPTRDPDDPTVTFTATVKDADGAVVWTGALNPQRAADGTSLTFTPQQDLQPGWTFTVTALLRAHGSLESGTVIPTSVTATTARAFDRCTATVDTKAQPAQTLVDDCVATTTVETVAASPARIIKGVRGVGAGVLGAQPGDANYDDLGVRMTGSSDCEDPNAGDGFYRSPCAPITRPGGVEEWRVEVVNQGNIPMQKLSSIDVLPAVGDSAVLVADSSRNSRWATTFLGGVTLTQPAGTQGTLTTYYLTAAPDARCNRLDILDDTKRDGITAADVKPNQYPGESVACLGEVTGRSWQVYDEDALTAAQKASVKALKFVVEYPEKDGLERQKSLDIRYRTSTAPYAAQAEAGGLEPLAWNSIAAGTRGYDGASIDSAHEDRVSLVTEARRAGVALATGSVDLRKVVETPGGWSPSWLPPTYEMTLTCTFDGVAVPLTGATGAADGKLRVAKVDGDAPGTPFNSEAHPVNLPLYSSCTVVETPTPGADVSYSTTPAVAQRDFSTRADVAHGAPMGSEPTTLTTTLTVTNTYTYGGFSVTKVVDDGPATNEKGEPVTNPGPYSFTATCTLNGVETLAAADRAFTLAPGTTRTVSDVPAGASCTVTEGTASGASRATTTIALTQDGVVANLVTAKTRAFTLTPYSDEDSSPTAALAVTNTFRAHTVTVTKAWAGAGAAAWGNEPVTVRLRCTLANASPSSVVYDNTAVLTKASPVWTVPNIARGASCQVTEPASGGANTAVVSPASTFTLNGDRAVSVTNTFNVGSVRVTKALTGGVGATMAPATQGRYTVTLTCTRPIDGVPTPVAVPGATQVLTGAGTYTWTGLPQGATCQVTEDDKGLAASSAVSPASVVVGNATTVDLTVTNTFDHGDLQVTKAVEGSSARFAPTSFDATVTCTWEGAAVPLPAGGRISVTPGTPTRVSGIPVGATCAVAEDDEGQSALEVSGSVTIVKAATRTVSLTNTYETASLRVGKVVETAEDATVPHAFGFRAICVFEGATVLDEAFTLDDGDTRTFDDLPARAACTVTETDPREADATFTDVTVVGAAAGATPSADQAARVATLPELGPDDEHGATANTVEFTNSYDVAGVVLTKDLRGGAAWLGADRTFTAELVCTFAGERVVDTSVTLDADHGFTARVAPIVAGAQCEVVEDGLQGADAVTMSPASPDDVAVGVATVPAAGNAEVTVANWYLTGAVTVTKSLVGEAVEFGAAGDFVVRLVCTVDGADGAIGVPIPGGADRVVTAASPTATYTGLPSGAHCTLTEPDTGGATTSTIVDAAGAALAGGADGHTFTVAVDPAELVDDQAQPALGVVNEFQLAEVVVTEAVTTTATGLDGQPLTYGPYELTLRCEFDGRDVLAAEPMAVSLGHGEGFTWTRLPAGADCEIQQSDDPDATTTVRTRQGDDPSDDPSDDASAPPALLTSLLPLGQLNAAHWLNAYESATVRLSKQLEGDGAGDVTRTFPVQLRCVLTDLTRPDGAVVRDEEHELGGPRRLAALVERIPAGAACSVAELDAGGAETTRVTVDGVESSGTQRGFRLAAHDASRVDVVVVNTFPGPDSNVLAWDEWRRLASTGLGAALLALIALGLVAAGVAVRAAARRTRGNAPRGAGVGRME